MKSKSQKMSAVEMQKKLIATIRKTTDHDLLQEMMRLLETGATGVEVYTLNEEQMSAVEEAREQIRRGDFLTDEDANREADEWLSK